MSDSDVDVIETQEAPPAWGRASVLDLARAVAFALLAVGLTVGLHAYVGARLVAGLGLTGLPALLAWAALWGLFLSVFAAFYSRRWPRTLAVGIRWVAYAWLGLFALLVCAVFAIDLVSATAALARGRPLAGRWGPIEGFAVLALVVPAFVWGTFRALARARVERVSVPVPDLPPELEGYRIVQLSDLHIGDTMGRSFTRRVVEQVNALVPDAVAITGDLADGSAAHVRPEVAPLADLKARDGVFFVTGNHEYYNGLGGWLAEVRRLGMEVLLNEHRVVHRGGARLVIAGVTDHDGEDFSPEHACRPDVALEGAPEGAPRVLLAHQPRTAFRAGGLRIALQLSGHTHGGQFFPWRYIVRLQQPVLAGLETVGDVRVYTHRGTGFWGPPLRLFAPPEIAEITLVRG